MNIYNAYGFFLMAIAILALHYSLRVNSIVDFVLGSGLFILGISFSQFKKQEKVK